jgi:hypothetical protein
VPSAEIHLELITQKNSWKLVEMKGGIHALNSEFRFNHSADANSETAVSALYNPEIP